MWKLNTFLIIKQKCNGDILRKDTDDETLLDDEVHKFHEVVLKNQTSVTNFLEITKGIAVKQL